MVLTWVCGMSVVYSLPLLLFFRSSKKSGYKLGKPWYLFTLEIIHTEYFSFEVSLFLKRSKGSQKQVIKIYKSPLNQKLPKNYLHFNLCDKIITELKKRLQSFCCSSQLTLNLHCTQNHIFLVLERHRKLNNTK